MPSTPLLFSAVLTRSRNPPPRPSENFTASLCACRLGTLNYALPSPVLSVVRKHPYLHPGLHALFPHFGPQTKHPRFQPHPSGSSLVLFVLLSQLQCKNVILLSFSPGPPPRAGDCEENSLGHPPEVVHVQGVCVCACAGDSRLRHD